MVLDDGGEHARRVIYNVLMILWRQTQPGMAHLSPHHLLLDSLPGDVVLPSPLLHSVLFFID